MKLLENISNPHNRTKAFALAKLFSVTAAAQILIQIIGLVCGVLIIRNFTVQEYSWYTISNTVLGAMNILADGGIVMGVMAEGGKVWKDKYKLGSVINTGLKLRKVFSLFSIAICGIALIFLLTKNGASVWYSLIVLLCLLPAFYANLTDQIYEIAPKLHQDLKPLQYNQIGANLGRLALTLSTVFLFPFTSVALMTAGIPRMIANIRLKKIATTYVDFANKEINISAQKDILKTVKRVLPLNIYNIFSVQISVWVLSLFGTATAVAQTGALFRIGTTLTAFQILASSILVPRMARLGNAKKEIIKMLAISQAFLSTCCITFVTLTYIFGTEILKIFGNNYSGLETELVYTMIIFCLNMFATIQYNLNASRHWVTHPLFVVISNVLSILVSIFVFNIKELNGVLQMNISVSALLLLIQMVFPYYKILNNK